MGYEYRQGDYTHTEREKLQGVYTKVPDKYIKNITEEVATGLYEQIIDGHVNLLDIYEDNKGRSLSRILGQLSDIMKENL